MAYLIADLETVRRNLAGVQERVAAAAEKSGRTPEDISICIATKYVGSEGMSVLREAGVRIAAENRLQDMIAKQEEFGDDFEWHFIGAIQSRKVREIAARVTAIHSLGTQSARDKLTGLEVPQPRVLVQVNVSGEESKEGVAPEELGDFIAASPVEISGLMTMPPLCENPDDARPYFAHLRELAAQHDLSDLSMGTSQDYAVAAEEGATLIRVGSVLFDQIN